MAFVSNPFHGVAMKALLKVFLSAFLLLQIGQPVYALPDWAELMGYTLIRYGYISGYKDRHGKYVDMEFKGCKPGRKLYLDRTHYVICNCFDIDIGIAPEYVLFSDGSTGKLYLVEEDDIYDVLFR